jgi:TIGR03009 family protein
MRLVGLPLTAVLLAALIASAQPPAPPGAPPAAPPVDPALDGHLRDWQKRMGDLSNFYSDFEMTRTDAVFKRKSVYTGQVLCMKPNFARLRLENKNDKADYDAYICNGKSVYEYSGREKVVTEVKLTGPGADNLMLDFLGGMKADDVKRRFQITQFDPTAKYYVYLDIKPLLPKDKQEFEFVRIALFGPTVPAPYTPYLPAQVFMMKPNGDTEDWKLSKQQTNVPGVDAGKFQYVPVREKDGKEWPLKQAQTLPAQPGPMGAPTVPPGFGGPPKLPGGTNLPPGGGAVKP